MQPSDVRRVWRHNDISRGLGVVSALALRSAAWAIKAARIMGKDRSTPTPCRQCAALRAELEAIRVKLDEVQRERDELRARRAAGAVFRAMLPSRTRGTLQRIIAGEVLEKVVPGLAGWLGAARSTSKTISPNRVA
jgi:hypothetical protein